MSECRKWHPYGAKNEMDLQEIFGDPAVASVPHKTATVPVEGTWSEWIEERDGRTWRVIQKDGETVVPWEDCIPWE